MIEIKLNGKPKELRSNWNDVTYDGYCAIVVCQGEPFTKRLSVYSGIDETILNKLTMKSVNAIAEIVEFMDSPDDVHAFALPYESEIDIGTETYGKLEASKTALRGKKHPLEGSAEMIKIYTDEDINDKPITQVIGKVSFFLLALEYSWSNSSGLLNMNPPMKNWKQVLKNLAHLAAGEQPLLTREGQT